MGGQRERLLSGQRRIGDVLGTIGLSRSLLRVIDRRHRGDQFLVYGLMLVTLILLGLLVEQQVLELVVAVLWLLSSQADSDSLYHVCVLCPCLHGGILDKTTKCRPTIPHS